jgi:hypothetical protein
MFPYCTLHTVSFQSRKFAIINDLSPAVLNTFTNVKPFRPNRFRSLKNSESLFKYWRHQQYQSQPGQTTLSFPTLKY